MRVFACSIIGSALLTLGTSAYAQTVFANDSDDWAMISNVVDQNNLPIGHIYGAPKSKMTMEEGRVTFGAGKFVAVPDKQEVVACSVVGDKVVDFVALKVSSLSWDAVGNPIDIGLRAPSVTYHLAADTSDNLVEQKLLVDGKYPGFNIVHKSDALALKELAGGADRTPTMLVSFVAKVGDKNIRENIGLFLSFNRCKVASSTPPRSTTATPKAAPKTIPHQH
jgi:hypothetical protein